jgi:ferrous iron transport protein A
MGKTLLQLKINQWARVIEVLGGQGVKDKLQSLGVRVGVNILKVSDTPGPVIVKIGKMQLAIGRGLASKIIVEEPEGI